MLLPLMQDMLHGMYKRFGWLETIVELSVFSLGCLIIYMLIPFTIGWLRKLDAEFGSGSNCSTELKRYDILNERDVQISASRRHLNQMRGESDALLRRRNVGKNTSTNSNNRST